MAGEAKVSDTEWLVSPAAKPWLELAAAAEMPAHANFVAKLRRDLSAERTSLILQQLEYRNRAKGRFAQANNMFFNDKGLQQATDDTIARYKATQITSQLDRQFAGADGHGSHGADLCCGIGGDLMQFAEVMPVVGFDADANTACLARANLRLIEPNTDRSKVLCQDVLKIDMGDFDWWHCDPDRRVSGKRTSQAVLSSPSVNELNRLLAANPTGSLKLSPAAAVPQEWAHRAELEWIGHDRQCQQLWVRFERLAREPGTVTATTLDQRSSVRHTITGEPNLMMPVAPSIGDHIYEPSAAIVAARLTGHVAHQFNLQPVQTGIAYLTGCSSNHMPGLACFEVLECLPFDQKRLKSALRAGGFGRLEIKKRGIELNPTELIRKLRVDGDRSATLLIFPHHDRTWVAIARRVTEAQSHHA